MGAVDAYWPEIKQISKEEKRELRVTGEELDLRLEKCGSLPLELFRLTGLHSLELSQSTLSAVPAGIGELRRLTNLVFRGNKLTSLPESLGELATLKYLDVSLNALTRLPDSIVNCTQLQTLNLSSNCVSHLPNKMDQLVWLIHLDASNNSLAEVPFSLCSDRLTHFTELILAKNRISTVPAEIGQLGLLRLLDLSGNSISVLPSELCNCSKLRDLNLLSNPIADRRLLKLTKEKNVKAVLDYVKLNGTVGGSKGQGDKAKSVKKNKSRKRNSSKTESSEPGYSNSVFIEHSSDQYAVKWMPAVSNVRPFIMGCIVRGLDFSDEKTIRKFLKLQSKLHEDVCRKRVAGTIATHDLDKLCFPLVYTAMPPEEIKMIPLGRSNEVTAVKLVQVLTDEAEALRKDKKRNVYSGIHQYVYLVKDKPSLACLIDAEGCVISLPPITNAKKTRISPLTRDILVEVTSGESFATCNRIMEAFVKAIFDQQMESIKESQTDEAVVLRLQQIKVWTESSELKSTYPTVNDLGQLQAEVVRVGGDLGSQSEVIT